MNQNIKSQLPHWNLKNKRVIVRADLNVPIKDGTILSDFRLRSILPTIHRIQKQGGKVVLLGHLGRPKKTDPAYSLQQLMPWFEQHGFDITFTSDIESAYHESLKNPNTILLFENLRFFPGEKNHDKAFAQQLAQLCDYYVNDAFGTMHRNDTSVTLLAKQFPESHRSIGLLVEHELINLSKLVHHAKHPYTLIIGGAKVTDKIPIIEKLPADTVLLCPAIVFSFLHAQGKAVGKSLVDTNVQKLCQEILHDAKSNNKRIEFPKDYQIAHDNVNGPLRVTENDTIPADSMGISIGPKTIDNYCKEIKSAKTIVFNGLPGFIDKPETLKGATELLQEMAHTTSAFTVIAGGDLVGLAEKLHLEDKVSFCSTGGGAAIAYLSGTPLPGLEAISS